MLPFGGPRGHRRGRRDRRPDRPRHRAVLRRRHHLAGAGAEVRRRRRHRRRQLLAPGGWTPTSRWSSARSTRDADRRAPARASSPTRTAPRWPRCRCSSRCTTRPGLVAAGRQHLPGGLRQRPRRRRGARRPGRGGRRQGAASWPTTASAVELPGAGEVRPHRSPSTCCRWPARSSTTAATRPTRSRSSATSRRKILGIPDLLVSGHLRAGAGLHRPLAVDQRRVRRARCRPSGPPSSSADAPGRRAVRRPDPAAGGRPGPVASSAGSGRTRASTATAGSRCSSATTTCARARR